MIAERVTRHNRFSRKFPCPICDGGHDDKRGNGTRCWGFLSGGGSHAVCMNDAYAGALQPNAKTQGYHHRLDGPCKCGVEHGAANTPRARETKPERPTRTHQRHTPIATHVYRNRDGSVRFRVARFWSKRTGPPADAPTLPKCFPQREDTGWPGEWIDGLGDIPYGGLYRLQEVAEADPFAPVWIPEGEGKADELASHGEVATCHAGGAGKWHNVSADDLEALRGRQAVLLTDNDDEGRTDTEQGVALLLPIAATIRVLALPGLGEGEDVVDWLAAGHSIAELRRLAAAAPIITALLPSGGNSRPTTQDATTARESKTCPDCSGLREQLRIANTSLENLRRERAIESRYMSMPNAKLSAPAKLAMIAIRREMRTPTKSRPRDEEGREHVYRAAVGATLGCSESVVGSHIRKLADAGLIERKTVRKFDLTETYIKLAPLAETPEQVAEPERVATWGGKRVKSCPHCHSTDLAHTVTCRSCGSVMAPEELVEIEVADEARETTPPPPPDPQPQPSNGAKPAPTFPSEDLIAEQDAPAAKNSGPADGPGVNHHAERGAALKLAEALGWPRVEITRGASTGGDAETWQRFLDANPPDRVDAALAALKRMTPPPNPAPVWEGVRP
ncbi:MAG TPA: hypothetical protein VH393_03655 [Ktedonobacterales bacterium]